MADARIGLDAMGGDQAPRETVRGALAAVERDPDLAVVLVGREREILAEIEKSGGGSDRIEVVNAEEVVTAHDSPVEALKTKPDSSIRRSMEVLREGGCDALVAAGNTGATVAAATIVLKLLRGVRRPGIAVTLPSAGGGHTVLCDVGANIHCRALHLFHYGVMAAQYARDLLDCKDPTVGLLNIGSEEGKGTGLVKETAAQFAGSPINFIGNVEGNDVFSGRCDVIICEGFVGNVVLKTAEGLFEAFSKSFRDVREELRGGSSDEEGAGSTIAEFLHRFRSRMDWAEYGGAPLLGVNGLVLISHGRSDARAIRNAIQQAANLHRHRVLQHMAEGLQAS